MTLRSFVAVAFGVAGLSSARPASAQITGQSLDKVPVPYVNRMAVQPIEELWIGLHTGLGFLDVSEDDSAFLPLGAEIGGTVPVAQTPLLDICLRFQFPFFVLPGAGGSAGNPSASSDDYIGSEIWQFGLYGKAHLDLGN
jgi:hypothetical protein